MPVCGMEERRDGRSRKFLVGSRRYFRWFSMSSVSPVIAARSSRASDDAGIEASRGDTGGLHVFCAPPCEVAG